MEKRQMDNQEVVTPKRKQEALIESGRFFKYIFVIALIFALICRYL